MKLIYKSIRYFLLLLMLLTGISFASLNTGTVAIDLWVYSGELPLSLVIGISLLLGVLISSAYFSFPLLKRKAQVHYLSKKLKKKDDANIHS